MAKQNINVGTAANDKKGDSLRAAFVKVNANFTELYTELGLVNDVTLSLGAFEFAGSTLSTTDSTAIVIDQAATITSNLSVGGDIVPQTANGGDLGSSTLPWRSLYVSNNTIYIGGTAVGVDANGNLTVNGSQVTGGSVSSLVNGAHTASLGSTGALTLPGDIIFPDGTVDLICGPNVAAAVADAADAYTTYLDLEQQFIDLRDSDAALNAPATYAWHNLPSHTAYPLILAYSGGGLPPSNSLVTKAYSAKTARLNWLDAVAAIEAWGPIVTNVSVSDKTWRFDADGALTIPGDIKSEGNINIDINLADSTLRRWQFGEDGALTFPDATVQTTAYQVTKSITHTANLSAAGSSFGQGSSIAITDNYQTERVSITNSLGSIARATLANITSIGKIVILTSTSPHETYVDRYGFSGAVQSYVAVSNGGNGVVILMSLGSNGWKLMSTNE
jgi:hypothetical protein